MCRFQSVMSLFKIVVCWGEAQSVKVDSESCFEKARIQTKSMCQCTSEVDEVRTEKPRPMSPPHITSNILASLSRGDASIVSKQLSGYGGKQLCGKSLLLSNEAGYF